MKRENLELIVGVFMLVGILCLGYLSIRLGKMELFSGNTYQVYADFDSVSGLKSGAAVEIAGVEVGKVDRILLDQESEQARVWMKVTTGVKLQSDVIASVRTKGIIGDRFIKLKPGGSDKLLPPGGHVTETESAVDLEELLSKYIHGSVE